IPEILPHSKFFTIQVGEQTFNISGASLSSDAPSYFTNFFEANITNPPILAIDRSPRIFNIIADHLRGYNIAAANAEEFFQLYADALYYRLRNLIMLLKERETYVKIGDSQFKISRDLFNGPGDAPNFFHLAFTFYFAHPVKDARLADDEKPTALLRPPVLKAPQVTNRSAALFSDLVTLARNEPLKIHSDTHRIALQKECRYYRFRGLEQKLVKHKITVDPTTGLEEITLGLLDVHPDSINIGADCTLHYKRPYIDAYARRLIIYVDKQHALKYAPS
ncbi:hypothetical protein CANCADRAFT_11606, partial [Tortispora caseinolytica NRRL Y-17796]